MIDQQTKSKINELNESGIPMKRIAIVLGIDRDTVRKYLGIKAPQRLSITAYQKHRIIELRMQGVRIAKIAADLKLSRSTINKTIADAKNNAEDDGIVERPGMTLEEFITANGPDIEPEPVIILMARKYHIPETKAKAIYRSWRERFVRGGCHG